MTFTLHRWLKISLFNILIVSIIGVTLRYKIAYSLPLIDQKHLLHGHSHFAFAGWISQTLMVLMTAYLSGRNLEVAFKKYHWLLMANLLTAYAMLVAFTIEGYGLYSIIFSTLSIIVSYIFGVMYWKDLNLLPQRSIAHLWFKAALLFNILSSAGAFALALMMVNKINHQNWYLAAEYFFLHFQYNGWFFFACMGLLTSKFLNDILPANKMKYIFWLFASAFVPAYFLSTLWMHLPIALYALVIIAAFAQVAAWSWMLLLMKRQLQMITASFSLIAKSLFVLSAMALTVKLLLQLGSVIPSLSDLAFGFRPIVIGYLHLVLLAVITLFLIGYLFAGVFISSNIIATTGAIIFTCGIFLNEALLMIQGIAAIGYNTFPFINLLLLGTALVMFCGLLVLNAGQHSRMNPITS